jgi:hypothetical protein
MPVRRHVDRNAIDKTGKVRAVVEIEPAQEILIGLARAGMLGSDDAGDILDQLTGAGDRQILKICIAYGALRTRYCNPDLLDCAAVNDDLVVTLARIVSAAFFMFGILGNGSDGAGGQQRGKHNA